MPATARHLSDRADEHAVVGQSELREDLPRLDAGTEALGVDDGRQDGPRPSRALGDLAIGEGEGVACAAKASAVIGSGRA